MAPLVLDYITPFATMNQPDFRDGKWKAHFRECYKVYEGTPIADEYPFDDLVHDWRIAQTFFCMFVIPVLAGATELPPGEKRTFTWKKFYPVVAGRFAQAMVEADAKGVYAKYAV